MIGFALQQMPVAETTAITFLAPILLVVAAGPVLGERPGRIGWAAALTGFAGVLLIVWPGGGLVFGHVPDGVSLIGMAVVAASGVMVALKTRRPPPKRSA